MVMRMMIGLAMTLAPVFAQAQVVVEELLAEGAPSVIFAHRSADLGGLPENSLAWIGYAIEHGIDGVHINVQVTGDGAYVLLHDNTLNRTTDVERVFPDGPPGGPTRVARGGRDYVRDYSLAEIRQLTLIDGTAQGAHKVPTLEEALDVVDGRLLMKLGLKSYEDDTLAAVLEAGDTANVMLFDLFYSATDPEALLAVARKTNLPAAVAMIDSQDLAGDLDRLAAAVGPALRMVCVKSRGITPEFLAKADGLGVKVCISGWNGPEDSALIYKDDPAPWRDALSKGYAVSTDVPLSVMALAGR